MKHILAVALLLGCTVETAEPPQKKSLPSYTVEHVTIRLAISEPGVERSLLLIGERWYQAKTFANWRDAGGKTATIVRQSDGQAFITIDALTAPIEEDVSGERDTVTDINARRGGVDWLPYGR